MRPEIAKKIDENLNPHKVNLVGLEIVDNEIIEIIEAIKRFKHTATVID